MIPGAIKTLDGKSLQALIDRQVPESKTLEYKGKIPGKADREGERVVETVCAFANTAGGRLILGMETKGGIPVGLKGIATTDIDENKQRLENKLRDLVEPRVPPLDIHAVEIGNDEHVLVVDVGESWIAPHRCAKDKQFYRRTSAGNEPLDIGEVRTAFANSEGFSDRIRQFRMERVWRIQSERTPVALQPGARKALHVVPRASFSNANGIDIATLQSHDNWILPMGRGATSYRVNLDGFVTFHTARGRSSADAYTQVFRNGAVESVSVLDEDQFGAYIPSVAYEQHIIRALKSYLEIAGKLELHPPYFTFLSLVSVRGARLAGTNGWGDQGILTANDETLILPEIVIEDQRARPENALRPLFDMVWNAFGFSRSLNYDENGNRSA